MGFTDIGEAILEKAQGKQTNKQKYRQNRKVNSKHGFKFTYLYLELRTYLIHLYLDVEYLTPEYLYTWISHYACIKEISRAFQHIYFPFLLMAVVSQEQGKNFHSFVV